MTAPMVDYKIHWLKMMSVPESRAVVGRHDGINGRDRHDGINGRDNLLLIDMNHNTCPTNLTGHPALSVPCGFGENGLPIGLQLMGRRWVESTLFRAAYTYAEDRSFAIPS